MKSKATVRPIEKRFELFISHGVLVSPSYIESETGDARSWMHCWRPTACKAKDHCIRDGQTHSLRGLWILCTDQTRSQEPARVQAERIGVQSNLSEADVAKLIDDNTDSPLVGLFGPTVTNVLEQNLALDAATK